MNKFAFDLIDAINRDGIKWQIVLVKHSHRVEKARQTDGQQPAGITSPAFAS